MDLRGEWRNNSLVGVDGWCRTPFGPAMFAGQQWSYFEHFAPGKLASTTAYDGFTVTQITASSAGTLVMLDKAGGWLALTGGTHDGAGVQMQSDGEMYLPGSSAEIFFEASIQIADADDLDWFVGLANTDTNIFSTQPTAMIGFSGNDGDANLDFQVRDGGTGNAADTGVDVANATTLQLGFHVRNLAAVIPYINGSPLAPVTANITDEELAITFGMLNGATEDNNELAIDWVRVLQLQG